MKAGKKKREANEAATAAMLREGMENAAALALTMVNDVTAEGAMQKIKEMKTAIAKEAANMAKEAEVRETAWSTSHQSHPILW